MKIGEKIANLRIMAGMSQEQLAENLDVSRQSVSKWEMDQALPQLDKVIELCELFKISTDSLLKEKIEISKNRQKGNKYFGTDGF
ncbi:MAG: helix-turn-helix transcriptional regulator, partial [Clostridia bacterium]|nr:helix-turn-helix transcriptional regulator [Clostridia bacterium]